MTNNVINPLSASETRKIGPGHREVGRRHAWSAVMAGTALALAGYRRSARAQAVALVAVDIRTVDQGYRASKLLGRSVQNDKEQKIGTLDDLVVTKDHALFGVLQVGGFLGLGGHLVAVPYDSLNISDDGRKIVVAGASKDELSKLPDNQEKQ